MAQEHSEHADQAHGHPTAGKYLQVAAILGILTLIEVGIYYVESLGPLLPIILLVLAATKFVTVVMYYMHLKYDGRLMQTLFAGPFIIAAGILFTLMALFLQFYGPSFIHPGAAGH